MEYIDQPHSDYLREYIAVLKRRKWTVVFVTVLAVAAAVGWSVQQTPIYTSEARVLVKPLPSNAQLYVPPPNLQTESEIAESVPVASRVQQDLNFQGSLDMLLNNLNVDAVVETEVLVLTYSSPDPAVARQIADSFSRNYLEHRREEALEELRSRQGTIKRRMSTLSLRLQRINQKLGRPQAQADESLITALETQRNVVLTRLGALQQALDEVQPNGSASGVGEVIQPATTPSAPSSPNILRNGILASLLGLGLGIGLALMRHQLADRFRGRPDVERALDAAVLGTVPKHSVKKKRKGKIDLAVSSERKDAAAEAYRRLRTNVQFIRAQQQVKSILITSPSEGEGKTLTTANLGVALALAGHRVVLLSADLRRPTLERYFDATQREGLSSWLASPDHRVLPVVQDVGIPNLRLISSGFIPENPSELLASPRVGGLIKQLEGLFDVVLIDSAPIAAVSDAALLASHATGSLLVLQMHSDRSAAIRAREEIERAGSRLIGTVLNRLDAAGSNYYYYSSTTYQ